MLKILVTGGNGFIGSHLCEELLSEGYDTSILDIKFNENTNGVNCKKIQCDITNYKSLKEKIKDFDLIIHLAAISRIDDAESNPIRCYDVNVKGILHILEIIKNSKTKLIFISSREVYGEPKIFPVKEINEKNPLTVYGSSKLAAEQLLKVYEKLYSVKHVTLRLANIYGSQRDLPQRVIPKFIEMCKNNLPLTINGGNQVIDFTFIDDVIDGIIKLIKKIEGNSEIAGKDYNFASGVGTSITDLAHIIKEIFQSKSDLIFYEQRNCDVQKYVGEFSKANKELGFLPKNTLKEGLLHYKKRKEK